MTRLIGASLIVLCLLYVAAYSIQAYNKETCDRVTKQLHEHNEKGLYPGFYVTDDERFACKDVGMELE